QKGGEPVESIIKFHAALRELAGRRGIRNEISRYEAVALAMVEMFGDKALLASFPPASSPIRVEQFFNALYVRYDERFVYSAPALKGRTERVQWSAASPAFDPVNGVVGIDYEPRILAGS